MHGTEIAKFDKLLKKNHWNLSVNVYYTCHVVTIDISEQLKDFHLLSVPRTPPQNPRGRHANLQSKKQLR